MTLNGSSQSLQHEVLAVLERHWGFTSLRPLQQDAIAANLQGRESLVVLPTGGGKSLCYQIPAALDRHTHIVVSPLIALMKDQVDGLRQCGISAASLNSSMSASEQLQVEQGLLSGQYRLLYVAPERLLMPRFLEILAQTQVHTFAIDEAHCISQWGHDFRPEYRQLAQLKTRFPHARLHAFTATATERVRNDIISQLQLHDPTVLVGTFDRPNLVYRILPRIDARQQVMEVLRRHSGQAAIVYCLSRKDCEAMAAYLVSQNLRAACYHAGMSPEARHLAQDQFANEHVDIIAATVAFGMGIDRSDVRCVIHAAMPKSIEGYQQETGRAGRDGLDAECVMLYSAADALRWEQLISSRSGDGDESARSLLREIRSMCNSAVCRHRFLSEYFGQPYPHNNCNACDVCLQEVDIVGESTLIAQKILSCVARIQERFGIEQVVSVLVGADSENVRRFAHQQLSTYGLLRDTPRTHVRSFIYQLIDAGVLERSGDDRPILHLSTASWEVLRNQRHVQLIQPAHKVKAAPVDAVSWEGVDRNLLESLRSLRRKIADEKKVPPYVVFSDATLRELARVRPGSLSMFAQIRGVGQHKLTDFGPGFVAHITSYCATHSLDLDAALASRVVGKAASKPASSASSPSAAHQSLRQRTFELFSAGRSPEEIAETMGRSPRTIVGYLTDYIAVHPQSNIDQWVPAETQRRIALAVEEHGNQLLKPIFIALGEQVSYDHIRLTLAYLRGNKPENSSVPEG